MRPTGFRTFLLLLVVGCGSAPPLPVAPPEPPPPAPRSALEPLPPTPAPIVAPLPSLPPVALAEVDEATPLTLEASAPAGTWLAYCRQGAPPAHLELARGERASEGIDDLLGWEKTGRFVVVRRAGTPTLLDLVTDTPVDLRGLGFDDRDDALDKRQHRALAFDPRGEILAYVRRRGGRSEVVLRTLVSGEERVVPALPGEPWRLDWESSGEMLVVAAMADDTTKNGSLDFPVRLRKTPRFGCSGLSPSYHVSPAMGDTPTWLLVPREGTTFLRADDFVAPFGRGYVARNPDGGLVLVREKWRQQLADADCLARVLFPDPAHLLALVSCTNDKQPPRPDGTKPPKRVGVELVGIGYRQELGVVVQPMALDRWPEAPSRLVALYPGSDTLLVDLEQRRPVPLRPGDRVLATSGPRALVRRERTLLSVDAALGQESPVLTNIEPFATLLVEGGFVAVGSTLLDVASGRVAGTFPGRPLALEPNGQALVAEGGFASADAFARGPLRWHRAKSAK